MRAKRRVSARPAQCCALRCQARVQQSRPPRPRLEWLTVQRARQQHGAGHCDSNPGLCPGRWRVCAALRRTGAPPRRRVAPGGRGLGHRLRARRRRPRRLAHRPRAHGTRAAWSSQPLSLSGTANRHCQPIYERTAPTGFHSCRRRQCPRGRDHEPPSLLSDRDHQHSRHRHRHPDHRRDRHRDHPHFVVQCWRRAHHHHHHDYHPQGHQARPRTRHCHCHTQRPNCSQKVQAPPSLQRHRTETWSDIC
mmetsp:Transcript_16189/g.38110  ORF Transcript_16189/g.38110 Transcript_16189/m.38110 type:complete len:249 (+) Transcript_16189:538-1284(+)